MKRLFCYTSLSNAVFTTHCLIKYLDYNDAQAQKIAMEVHTKGKCAILEGSFTEVEVYRKILQQEGLTVSID
ncbi:MAG: hypothetical protein EOP42_18080 [Sphingobacteriaceae bacterium]|nr:MAG: hypothetical protein EOP42_18080 [Sphingobacteriaceae bacterium]